MKQISIVLFVTILIAACNNSSGWSSADKDKAAKACMDQVQGKIDDATAKKYCSCVLDKMMQKYPTYAQADKQGTEEEGMKIGQACAMELKIGNQGNNNNGGLGGGLGNGNTSNWTQEQFQQYVQGCSGTAQQAQGMTPQQANAYCECMTKKVAAKYSFEVAARMTAADFQTEEWQNAANECRAQVMGQQQ
jgi:hypothetical protein